MTSSIDGIIGKQSYQTQSVFNKILVLHYIYWAVSYRVLCMLSNRLGVNKTDCNWMDTSNGNDIPKWQLIKACAMAICPHLNIHPQPLSVVIPEDPMGRKFRR